MRETLAVQPQNLDYYNYFVMCNYVFYGQKPLIENSCTYEENGVLYCASATEKGVYCYTYARNCPLMYTDPDGEWIWLIPIVIAGAINVATNWDAIMTASEKGGGAGFGKAVGFFALGAVNGAATYFGGPLIGAAVGYGTGILNQGLNSYMNKIQKLLIMNPKHPFPAILFSTLFLLCSLSAKTQSISDTIRIERNIFGVDYYQNNKMLNFSQLMDLSTSNPAAHKLMKDAYTLHIFSICMSSAGGFLLGYSAGYAIGRAVKKNQVDMNIFISILGVGAGITSIGIGFELWSNNKTNKGVLILNNAVKQKNSANVNLGLVEL